MAVLTRSIQSGGGGDYTTIQAWEADAPNLGTDIWKGEIDDDAEYNESVTFSNSGTPSATSYYWLTGGTNNRHAGVPGTGHPRVRSTSGHVFNVQEDFTRVEWLEINQDSGGSSDEGFRFNGSGDLLVSHCIVYSGTPSSDQDGFYCANNDSSVTIDNCILYGWNRSGVHFQNFGSGGVTQTLNLDHSTLHDPGNNGAVHIRSNSADSVQTVNMYNNNGASDSGEPFADSGTGNPSDDPNGTVTWNGSHNLKDHTGNANIGGTNNLTDWQSATDGITDVSKTSGAWLVVDSLTAGSESYLLKDAEAGNLAVDNGIDRQGSEPDTRQDFSVDITGGTRPTTSVDIGAHEFAATGTALLKVENETEETSETDLSLLDLIRIEGESEEISEAILRLQDLLRLHNEAANIAEVELTIVGLTRQEDEATNLSETDLSVRGFLRVESEQTQISETDLTFKDLTRVISETLNASETDLKFLDLIRQVNEITQLPETDLRFLALLRQADETVQVSEVTIPVVGLLREESDTLNISETDLNIRGIFRVEDEDLQISETDFSIRGVFRIEDEATNLSETDATLLALTRIESETVNLVESDLRFSALIRTETETTQLSETDLRFLDLLRLVSETSNLTEADIAVVTEFGVALIKVVDEGIDLAEVDLHVLGVIKVEDEVTEVSETTQRLRDLTRLVAESETLDEAIVKLQDLVRIQDETATLPESVVRVLDILKTQAETLNAQESPTFIRGLPARIVSETLQATETTLRSVAVFLIETLRRVRNYRDGERDYDAGDRDYRDESRDYE